MTYLLKVGENDDELETLVRQVADLGPKGRRAAVRAVRKTTQWAERKARGDVAKASRLPVRAVREAGRVRSRLPSLRVASVALGDDRIDGQVWVGLNPVSARLAGTLSQTRVGARAGRHSFPGGFVAQMRSGYRSIFKRAPGALREPANNRWGITALPINEQQISLNTGHLVMGSIQVQARRRLRDLLVAELNYEVNVKR